jgi:hypothetical protein
MGHTTRADATTPSLTAVRPQSSHHAEMLSHGSQPLPAPSPGTTRCAHQGIWARALWRNWSGYHRRSRAKTKMHCVKLLGQRLMARDFDRQVAEVQVRVAILNGYTALGIPVTKAVG